MSCKLICPLPAAFFSKQGKRHSSQIRRAIHKGWGIKGRDIRRIIRNDLVAHAEIILEPNCDHWTEAFKYAEDWNNYKGQRLDAAYMEEKLIQQIWGYKAYTLHLSEDAFLKLASLSFESDAAKESPNHLFLKELGLLYLSKYKSELCQLSEFTMKVFDKTIRCDVVGMSEDRVKCVIEVGGVQLWKVLALLHKGIDVVVLPHWTRQKINPFIRRRLQFKAYVIESTTLI